MLHAFPFTTQHGVSSGWRWRQPPDLEANYKYAVTNSWQCGVIVREGSKVRLTPLHFKQTAHYRSLHRPQNTPCLLNTAL